MTELGPQWEQVHQAENPDRRESWSSKALAWVCKACGAEHPNHFGNCPITGLEERIRMLEAENRGLRRDREMLALGQIPAPTPKGTDND